VHLNNCVYSNHSLKRKFFCLNTLSVDDEAAEDGSDWGDKSSMVLQYLQILEAMKTTAGEDENGLSAEAAMKVADLREIYFSAVDLLRRLGRSYRDEQAKLTFPVQMNGEVGDNNLSGLDLESRAMYFDMCTYLCGLVKRLRGGDVLTAVDLEEDDEGSAIEGAPVFLESLPYNSRL